MEDKRTKTRFKLGLMEDEHPILLLQITIILINDCTIDQLENIPRELSKNLLTYLTKLWAEVRKHILINTIQEYDSERLFYLTNIRTNNLAESLFRLSMEATFTMPSMFLDVERSIFHSGHVNFESFILTHFEKSPLFLKKPSNASFHNNIFSSFAQFQNVPSFLTCLLQNLTSALPIGSDELDIITYLKEAREHIGRPLVYQQDIRVVKTLDSKEETHFFLGPHFLYERDILRCEEAYKDGYTFALRGMEFRFDDIAAISEGLTFLFGQPSIGVNMYLTPPNSQGLARHRDDHCVLVCQIRGVKRWKVFPNPFLLLPRLYECVDDFLDVEGENEIKDGCEEFLLGEGDILYIPRGFPHEACTETDDAGLNGNVDFSLHLTLAIEVEPPFEWEGFLHIGLHQWGQNYNPSKSSSPDLNNVAIHLMHIAIKLIGDINPTLRMACLIGSISFPLTHQKSTFTHLINRINIDTKLNKIVSNIETTIEKQEDLFENLSWLCHLDLKASSIGMEDLFYLIVNKKDEIEDAFMEVKSKFCREIVFEDVVHHYGVILEKYRRTRKRYVNGMLSLNCI